MGLANLLRVEERFQWRRKLQRRLAGRQVRDPDAVPVGRRLDAGAQRLGESLLGGEALRQVVRRLAVGLEPLELRGRQDALGEAFSPALQRLADAFDFHHVRTHPEDHRAARTISAFISRTASRMPMNTARDTMAWPMCSSRTPGSAATGCTLK